MKTFKSVLALTAVASAFVAAPASAALLTFEGQANTIYNAPIVRDGFTVGNVAGDEQHFHEIDSNGFGLPSNGTGVMLNDRDTRIFVEAVGLLDFSLTSVDVASALNNLPAIGIEIEGFLDGVSKGVITLGALGGGYTTLLGAALGTVDRLVFDGIGGGGGFVLDNLALGDAVNGTPEPLSLALVLSALAAGAGVRRARRS